MRVAVVDRKVGLGSVIDSEPIDQVIAPIISVFGLAVASENSPEIAVFVLCPPYDLSGLTVS